MWVAEIHYSFEKVEIVIVQEGTKAENRGSGNSCLRHLFIAGLSDTSLPHICILICCVKYTRCFCTDKLQNFGLLCTFYPGYNGCHDKHWGSIYEIGTQIATYTTLLEPDKGFNPEPLYPKIEKKV